MKNLRLGYATRNKSTDSFLYGNKNIVRMAESGSFTVFVFRHVPRSDSPNMVWYSDPRVAGVNVPGDMLRLVGEK